jgi:hypothetical protein
MTESDRHHEPHVSAQDLRAALTKNGRSRPNPLMAEAPPAWEWTTDEQVELERLRESCAALQAQVDELRAEAEVARRREHELRGALRRLAAARLWHRRGVVTELSAGGLL